MAAHHPGAGRKQAPLASQPNSHSLVMAAELPVVKSVELSRRRPGMRNETAHREWGRTALAH